MDDVMRAIAALPQTCGSRSSAMTPDDTLTLGEETAEAVAALLAHADRGGAPVERVMVEALRLFLEVRPMPGATADH